MKAHSDAIVIGAGPAGCSAAITLAQAGRDVVLLDRAHFPRPKACGEGVMPGGVRILDDLGVLPEVEKWGKRFKGIRFISPLGRAATGLFANGTYGIAIPREKLDAILLERARSYSNITIMESQQVKKPLFDHHKMVGIEPQNIFATHHLIADGASSSIATAMGLRRRLPKRRRFGMSAHFTGVANLQDVVEVFFLDGGEIYIAAQAGEGNALIAVLIEESRMKKFAGRTQEGFLEMVKSCPVLADRMSTATQTTKILGLGPLGGDMKKWNGPGWWLIGDAASSLDPITGEGISTALANGQIAARDIISPGPRWMTYAMRRRRLLWKKILLAKILLITSTRLSASDWLITKLSRHPGLFRWFLENL